METPEIPNNKASIKFICLDCLSETGDSGFQVFTLATKQSEVRPTIAKATSPLRS